jgi:chloramphenicol O-acetyltransferase type B
VENYFENPFSSELLCETLSHPNIQVGTFSYYSGYYHKHSFLGCIHYLLAKKGTDKLIMGNYCSIASGAIFMMGGNQGHKADWASTFPFYFQANIFKSSLNAYSPAGDTVIGSDVWIGSEAMILPGIHIGSGAIVAARSVVTKNVPPYAIVGGNPASILKYRFDDETIQALLQIQWWNKTEESVKELMPLICSTDIQSLLALNRD